MIVNEIGAEKSYVCPEALSKQVYTTLQGLSELVSPVVIKVRSDEWCDLSDFIKYFESNKKKILFSNFIVRPWSYHPFHISDHLFGGDKAVIEAAFQSLSRTSQEWLNEKLGMHAYTPESCIGFMIFRSQQLGVVPEGKKIKAPEAPNWKFFCGGFELYDLQRILGKFEVNARRAQVGPVGNLRELGRLLNKDGLGLDFVYYPDIESLKPQSRVWTSFKKRYRHGTRKYLAPLSDILGSAVRLTPCFGSRKR